MPPDKPKGNGRFVKGEADPRRAPGKPKGCRHRATQVAAALAAGDLDGIVRTAVRRARAGDPAFARILLDRLWPVPRDRPLPDVELPQPASLADLPTALIEVLRLAGAGEIDLGEAGRVADLLDRWRLATETVDLDRRLAAVEQRLASRGGLP